MDTQKTVAFLAEKLKSRGYNVAEGVGGTGLVVSVTVGNSTKAIGMRANFDALPIIEDSDLAYKSTTEVLSHLCGNDAHCTMLLGAGKYSTETKNFNGTVRMIFQLDEDYLEGATYWVH